MKKTILSAAIAVLTLSACQSDKTEVSEDDNGVVTLSSKGIDYELLLVNAGTFNIGATSEMKDITPTEELPMHEVKLTKDYYIGKTEVTQELWESVMGNNPSAIKEGKNLPVVNVSWEDCQQFVKKLNPLTGKQFRLPTEAE